MAARLLLVAGCVRHKSAAAALQCTQEAEMKTAWLLGAALLLSACAAPQQAYYAPPAPRTTPAPVQPRVSPPAAPRSIAQQPVRVPQTVPSAGPLRTAMIGGYMDNQERDFREHLRGL